MAQHDSSGGDRDAFGIEPGHPERDRVGIDELADSEHVAQEPRRDRRFPSAVRPCNYRQLVRVPRHATRGGS
jgi:hypothetical protein